MNSVDGRDAGSGVELPCFSLGAPFSQCLLVLVNENAGWGRKLLSIKEMELMFDIAYVTKPPTVQFSRSVGSDSLRPH